MDFEFNFNQWVKVRLTHRGIDILRQRHDELDSWVRSRNGRGISPFQVNIDAEGYTQFQFWHLMQTFGGHMDTGYEIPFNGNMIFCGGKEIKRTSTNSSL